MTTPQEVKMNAMIAASPISDKYKPATRALASSIEALKKGLGDTPTAVDQYQDYIKKVSGVIHGVIDAMKELEKLTIGESCEKDLRIAKNMVNAAGQVISVANNQIVGLALFLNDKAKHTQSAEEIQTELE